MRENALIAELFSDCGLNATEVSVLLQLLRSAGLRAARLAVLCELKRPTVYAALETLERRGLVAKEQARGGTVFRALGLQQICSTLRAQAKSDYQRVVDSTGILKTHLENLPRPAVLKVGSYRIRTINNAKASYQYLEQVLLRGNFVAIFNPQKIPKRELHTVVAKFLRDTAITQPRIREILVKGPQAKWYLENIRNKNHLTREISSKANIKSVIIPH